MEIQMMIENKVIKKMCNRAKWGFIISLLPVIMVIFSLADMIMKGEVIGSIIVGPVILFFIICSGISYYTNLYRTVYRIDRDGEKVVFHTIRQEYVTGLNTLSFDKKRLKWIVKYNNRKLFICTKIPHYLAAEAFKNEEIEYMLER